MNENITTMEQMAPTDVARAKAWLAGMLELLLGGIQARHGVLPDRAETAPAVNHVVAQLATYSTAFRPMVGP